MIRPAFNNTVRYFLEHESIGRVKILEPKGWDQIDEEFSRDKEHGTTKKYTSNNSFVSNPVTIIENIYAKYGVNAKIRSIRQERNPKTNKWTETFNQILKPSSYTKQDGALKIGSYPSELEDKIKSIQNEKFELGRLDALNGNVLDPLELKVVELKGKNIFLRTTYEVDDIDNSTSMYDVSKGFTRGSSIAVPVKIIGKSHANAHSVLQTDAIGDNSQDRSADGAIESMFFSIADRKRELMIKFTLSFKINVLQYEDVNWANFWVLLSVYEDGSNFKFKKEEKELFFAPNNISSQNGSTLSFSFNEEVTVLAGESLSLRFSQLADLGNAIDNGRLELSQTEIECEMSIEEDSFFESSQTQAVSVHDIGERLCQIATGKKGLFYSEAMGRIDLGYKDNGEWGYVALSVGFWIRLFNEKTFKISYKEFKSFFNAILGMSVDFNIINGVERMVVEPFDYFYQNFIGVRLLNEIAEVKEKYYFKGFYSAVEVGSTKGGVYESIIGLTEYNTKTNWATILDVDENKYIALSDVRRDSLEVEIIRRKPKILFPDEDTRSDEDVFAFDCKKGVTEVWEQRYWQDDFDEEPKGIFSPKTATNLRFSDTRCMLRHGIIIRAGLTKYLDKNMTFLNSIGNSSMTTKKNGIALKEDKKVLNSALDLNGYELDQVQFTHTVDFDVLQQINGTTNINGREVPNLNGLIEYVEGGKKHFGRFKKIKPRGKGSFTILKVKL